MAEKSNSPEEILEEARKMIGQEKPPLTARYHVEHEPIRRYCMMVDDDNPLFLDPEYAGKTKYGSVILPPFAVFGISSIGSPAVAGKGVSLRPPTPGKYLINTSQEWEWFKPVPVGDRITIKAKLVDVYIKPIRVDPKAFWIVNEISFWNKKGERVAVLRNTALCHRSPEQIKQES